MGNDAYKAIHEMEGWAQITGNQQYYLLVAMKMDRENYHITYDWLPGDSFSNPTKHVKFVWEDNPEFVEIVW